MLRGLVLSLAMAFAAVSLVGCKGAKLDNDKAKYSYAIGSQIGNNMKSQEIELDMKAFTAGLEDALGSKDLKLSEEDMKKAMQAMSDIRNKKREEKANKNKAEGEKFLEANKAKEGVKVTPSGLQYMVEKEGEGDTPKDGDIVEVHYKGTFINGEEFDSSYKRNRPAKFPVNGVIKGWTEALKMMKKGAKWKLFIPSDLAYGPRGNPSIPGNSVLIFEVELLNIEGKKDK